MFLSRYSVLFMLPASIIPSSCQQAYNSCFCPAYLPFLQSVLRIPYVWDTHKSLSQVINHRVRKKNYTKFLAAYFRHTMDDKFNIIYYNINA